MPSGCTFVGVGETNHELSNVVNANSIGIKNIQQIVLMYIVCSIVLMTLFKISEKVFVALAFIAK